MKRAILEGARVGAIIGFCLAILNAVLVLISVELSWPIPTPQKVVIFTSDFFATDFLSFLMASLLWAIPSALIGGVTAGLFGFILVKYQFDKKRYFLACNVLCVLIAGAYIGVWVCFIGLGNYMANRLLVIIIESPLIGIVLVIFPAIVFILAGRFVSHYLLNQFSPSTNVIPTSP